MSATKLAAKDAWWYWAGKRIASDQFLVYVFDGAPASLDEAIAHTLEISQSTPDLRLRIVTTPLGGPSWVPCDATRDQVSVHELPDATWQAFLQRLAELMSAQLDQGRHTWRLHVFPHVRDVPTTSRPATVVVVQISHSLGDGSLAAALAGRIFGRTEAVPAVLSAEDEGFVARLIDAAAAYRRLSHGTETDTTRPPVPALSSNNDPAGASMLGTLVVKASELEGPTVAIGGLLVIADALSSLLRERGERVDTLTAEVATAKPGVRRARNHYTASGIGLYPELRDRDIQTRCIAKDLERSRHGDAHPGSVFREYAFRALPRPVQSWAVLRVKWPHQRHSLVSGNTVVSRVHRGDADLHFGGCPVVFTSGYPALSHGIGLTHGLHSIGDTVAISVHSTRSVVTDMDDYLSRLAHAVATRPTGSDG